MRYRVVGAGVIALVLVACVDARAIGSLAYKSPQERALGIGGAAWVFALSASERGATLVEAGQRYPFDIPGLAATHVRFGAASGTWSALLSGVVLTSPVGEETFAALELAFRRRRWALAVALGHHAAVLDEGARSDALTISVAAQAHAGGFAFGYRIDGYRVAGEMIPGADTSAYVFAFPDATVSASVKLQLRRNGSLTTIVGGRMRLGRVAYAALGYEDGTGALNAAAGVSVTAIGLDVGASFHPVLGVSQSIFVSWRR